MNKSIRDILNEYLSSVQYSSPKSDLTLQSYKRDLTHFIKYLEDIEIKDFRDLSYEELLTYINELSDEYAPNSVYRKISSIRVFYQYLLTFNYIEHDITTYMRTTKRHKTLPKVLTVDQVRQLLSFEEKEPKDYLDKTIILLLFRTGLRVSECTNLEFVHFYQEERLLRFVGKGNKERIVPMSQDVYDALQYYIQSVRPIFEKKRTNRIFITPKGNPISRQYVHRVIQLRRMETGLNAHVSAHTLRHSLATSMLDQEVDLRIIQEMLGHADISTTQIYTHVKKNTLRNEYEKYIPGGFDFNTSDDTEGEKE